MQTFIIGSNAKFRIGGALFVHIGHVTVQSQRLFFYDIEGKLVQLNAIGFQIYGCSFFKKRPIQLQEFWRGEFFAVFF
jgi:hypothetical protein